MFLDRSKKTTKRQDGDGECTIAVTSPAVLSSKSPPALMRNQQDLVTLLSLRPELS